MESGPKEQPIVLSDEEAAELYRFTLHDYINPSKWPALSRLLDRCGRRLREMEQPTCR